MNPGGRGGERSLAKASTLLSVSVLIEEDADEARRIGWRTRNRPFQDLSHGWGSNSQWRTSFRRDYRIGQEFHYNVDGKHDLAAPGATAEDRDGLTREERTELLTNRCFVRTTKPHGDLWPYDDILRARA